MVGYFKDCKTEQETKKAYRTLSKILHPDLGGTHDQFIELEKEYLSHLKSLNGSFNSKEDERDNKRRYYYDEKIERDLMAVLRALQGSRFPDHVEIAIQGTWIWVKGTHKDFRGNYPLDPTTIARCETLGLKHHTMKGECYYRDPSNKAMNKDKVMSYDKIARKYRGSSYSNNSGQDQLSA